MAPRPQWDYCFLAVQYTRPTYCYIHFFGPPPRSYSLPIDANAGCLAIRQDADALFAYLGSAGWELVNVQRGISGPDQPAGNSGVFSDDVIAYFKRRGLALRRRPAPPTARIHPAAAPRPWSEP